VKRLLFAGLGLALLAAPACDSSTADTKSDGPNPVVVMETSKGTIKIELFADKSPITVKNFLTYVDEKFYDGTTFHRVMPNFMIQGGGFKPGLTQAQSGREVKALEKETHDPIKNEAKNGVHNVRGTIAMARTDDADSATSQFFISVVDNTDKLDPGGVSPDGYAVFGKVIDGMDVVDAIKDVKTTKILGGAMANIPVEDVMIKSVRRADK